MSDRETWRLIEELYRAEFARFVRVARAITEDRESAVEAVQEGFADALRRSSQWSGQGALGAWVWSCVVNRAHKVNRARKSRPRTEAPFEGETPFAAPGVDVDLRGRLAELPERQRLVVFLRYFADLSYEEIAAVVGVRVGTVSATLHAAHVALRAELEGMQG